VGDSVVISHRGAAYEIGRGRGFYGIWPAGAPRSQPAEWWPATPAGWSGAWSRFTRLEAPAAIVPVRADPILKISTSTRAIIAAVLLAVGVVFGAGALFPGYIGHPSLVSEAGELVPHLIYLAVWLASTVLILLGGARLRVGALLAAGTSVVTLGLFFADLGTATSGSNLVGAGLVLAIIGWACCSAGAAMAVWIRPDVAEAADGSVGAGADGATVAPGARGELSVAPRYEVRPARWLAAAVVAALGVAVTFAPAWDSYTLRTASGQSESLTAGNAFANPGAVIAGDVMVMIALVAVVIAAGLLRPVRQGGVLLLGAIIPMVAQAISAIIQLLEPATPAQFGISPAQAALSNLTISSGATASFWLYCIFTAAAVLIGVRMILLSRPAATAPVPQPWIPAAGAGPAGGPPFGTPASTGALTKAGVVASAGSPAAAELPAAAGVPADPGMRAAAGMPDGAAPGAAADWPHGAPGPAAPGAPGSPRTAPPPADTAG
jgi:hypothetical protein